jgi:very-short-patch-repair endonuclease
MKRRGEYNPNAKKYGQIEKLPNQSATERILLRAMKKYKLNPVAQYKVGEMHVDIAFPGQRVVVEIDGVDHEKHGQKLIDIRRDYYLRSRGWAVWRFEASKVFENPYKIACYISHLLERKG